MPRRGPKAPSSDSGLAGGSVTVVSGSIRTPDDPDALSVKLSIWDTEITMRVDGAELGNWVASEINIRAIDSGSFEFIAEGDQLIFTPDDPAAFAASSLVKGRDSGGRRQSRRKAREKTDRAPAAVVVPEPSPEMESRRSERRSVEQAGPSKPSRRERKAAEREAAETGASDVVSPPPMRESTVRRSAVPTPIGRATVGAGVGVDIEGAVVEESPTIRIPAFRELEPEPEPADLPDPSGWQEPERAAVPDPSGWLESEPIEPPERIEARPVELLEPDVEPEPAATPEEAPRRKKSLLRRSTRGDLPEEVAPPDDPTTDELEEQPGEQPNRLWIRALDLARKYDFLGLDRVPVNESLRGQEHQHTWDHRVAPSSGPGKHICTICGDIRR